MQYQISCKVKYLRTVWTLSSGTTLPSELSQQARQYQQFNEKLGARVQFVKEEEAASHSYSVKI